MDGENKGKQLRKGSRREKAIRTQNLKEWGNSESLCRNNGIIIDFIEDTIGESTENRRVGLQEDIVARAHGLEASHGDVLLVAETETDQI